MSAPFAPHRHRLAAAAQAWRRALLTLLLPVSVMGVLFAAPVQALTIQIGDGKRVDGSGNVIEEARALTGFKALTITGPVDVQLKASDTERVVVRGDDNVVPLITTTIESERLVVGLKSNTSIHTRNKMHVTVEFKQMNGILIRGSGDVRGDIIKAPIFEAVVRGSGDIVIDRIEADAVALSINGSGDFTAGGRAGSLGVNVSGSGDVHTENLEARQVAVRIRGSGDVRVHAAEALQVDIAGSGDVRYRGSPQLTVKKAGSGDVRAMR
jgi:hypothetical protein